MIQHPRQGVLTAADIDRGHVSYMDFRSVTVELVRYWASIFPVFLAERSKDSNRRYPRAIETKPTASS